VGRAGVVGRLPRFISRSWSCRFPVATETGRIANWDWSTAVAGLSDLRRFVSRRESETEEEAPQDEPHMVAVRRLLRQADGERDGAWPLLLYRRHNSWRSMASVSSTKFANASRLALLSGKTATGVTRLLLTESAFPSTGTAGRVGVPRLLHPACEGLPVTTTDGVPIAHSCHQTLWVLGIRPAWTTVQQR
jgi:hypothetical protein